MLLTLPGVVSNCFASGKIDATPAFKKRTLILGSKTLLGCKLTDARVKVGDGGSERNDY
jgi:hypothetical protein